MYEMNSHYSSRFWIQQKRTKFAVVVSYEYTSYFGWNIKLFNYVSAISCHVLLLFRLKFVRVNSWRKFHDILVSNAYFFNCNLVGMVVNFGYFWHLGQNIPNPMWLTTKPTKTDKTNKNTEQTNFSPSIFYLHYPDNVCYFKIKITSARLCIWLNWISTRNTASKMKTIVWNLWLGKRPGIPPYETCCFHFCWWSSLRLVFGTQQFTEWWYSICDSILCYLTN